MGYSIINKSAYLEIIADTEADIADIRVNPGTGSRVTVAETGNVYRADTDGVWIKQENGQLDALKTSIESIDVHEALTNIATLIEGNNVDAALEAIGTLISDNNVAEALTAIKASVEANKPIIPSHIKAGVIEIAAESSETITADTDTYIFELLITNDDEENAVSITFTPTAGDPATFMLNVEESITLNVKCLQIAIGNAALSPVSVRYIVTECDV